MFLAEAVMHPLNSFIFYTTGFLAIAKKRTPEDLNPVLAEAKLLVYFIQFNVSLVLVLKCGGASWYKIHIRNLISKDMSSRRIGRLLRRYS